MLFYIHFTFIHMYFLKNHFNHIKITYNHHNIFTFEYKKMKLLFIFHFK